MFSWILICIEGDLDDRNSERVRFFVESYFEGSPDAVIKTSANRVGFNASFGECIDDFVGDFWRAFVGEGFFVVVCWEAGETGSVSTRYDEDRIGESDS